ncbi:hypothetical protein FDC62_06360 [Clostridium botulinum]|uniref:hypothetical protein n=1 Tax=Clostridium botulinum TaxID=1491 RepID=UPI00068BFCFF|nr:hypothetical protein [Clostridium botulinum]KOC50641.1 hypothetical protein ADU88_01840 [Clostridium botulinum]NFO97832.1 hypothetical protein [Clostridium botulinum]OOV52144.1 hypothetical protein B1A66_05645 [Clostridium botulinum D/C]OOV54574.1 hypothetical protein B0673_10325 [Clostridium botulinum D/C]OOV56876.1 hypothetical protein B1A67_05685 [Clostridium botulinum D/C]
MASGTLSPKINYCCRYCCQYCAQHCNNILGKPEAGIYIQILNKTNIPIYFIVQYSIDVRTFTKKSPILGYDKTEKISFAKAAHNICFNILDNSTNPPKLICNVALPKTTRYCFILAPRPGIPELVQVPC